MNSYRTPAGGILRRAGLALLVLPFSAARCEDLDVRALLLAELDGPLVLRLADGGISDPLPVSAGRLSEPVALPRAETWVFGSQGEDGFVERCRVQPPSESKVWLVIAPAPASAEDGETVEEGEEVEEAPALSAHAIGIDGKALRQGGVLVLNASPTAVEMQAGDETLRIEPQERKIHHPEVEFGAGYPVKFHFLHHDRMRPFVTTNWFRGENRRRLAVVVGEGGTPLPKLVVADEVEAER